MLQVKSFAGEKVASASCKEHLDSLPSTRTQGFSWGQCRPRCGQERESEERDQSKSQRGEYGFLNWGTAGEAGGRRSQVAKGIKAFEESRLAGGGAEGSGGGWAG